MPRHAPDRHATTHAALVAAASELVRDHGFDGLTVGAVMKAAGLTHGGFYAYYKNRDELVEQARQRIGGDEARQVILQRLQAVLMDTYGQYLRADQRACVGAIENLWGKYAVTAAQLEDARGQASAALSRYLAELGYE